MTLTFPPNGRARDWVLPGAAMAVYAGIGVWWLRFVFLSDFFQMIWIADAQRAWVSTAFANGFLGMGYPLTLNAVTWLTGDILTSGKLIQAASGVAILWMLPALSRGAFGDATGSRLAQLLLATNAVFFVAATGETPDLFATAFMVAGLVAATRYMRRPSVGAAIGVGVCLGLGYLVRYHSLLLLPLVMVVLFALAPERRRTIWWVLGGFVVAAAPQLVASGLVQGNPLYNLHIKSVSMGYYGVSSDFVEKTRPYTLVRVLTENPVAVIKQYAIFVIRYFTEIGGAMLLLAGAVLAKRREARGWALLALPAIALTFLLAAKFYTDRAILFQLVMWHVVVSWPYRLRR
jgi:4-amino-4-deoxy-L-arabinose transferase-like glycosyltransferase